MQFYKVFYFKNNLKKTSGVNKQSRKNKRKGKKSLLRFKISSDSPFLKRNRRKKLRGKNNFKVFSNKSLKLAFIYFLSLLFFIPLFSFIYKVDQIIDELDNKNFTTSEKLKETLPEIEVINDNALIIYSSKGLNEKKIEDIESPDRLIDERNIGEFLDEESTILFKNRNLQNPFIDFKETENPVVKAKKSKPYKVKKGDSLWTIAKENKITIDSLISLNKIKSPHQLREGSMVKVPYVSGIFYKIKKGDSLFKIAKKYNLKVDNIKKYNDNVIYLKPNSKIFLPQARLTTYERNLIFGNLFKKPVKGSLSSKYGMRFHPLKKRWLFHTGIDIAKNKFEVVRASASGIVALVKEGGNYGKYIRIKHKNNYETGYAHLSKINVKKGEKVSLGQPIGRVGNTGLSTGHHLHFEVLHNKKFINPNRFLRIKR